MKFQEFVCFEATIPELDNADRDAAIEALVSALAKAGGIPAKSSREITEAVIKRENEASTGMGKGVAVPHGKTTGVTDLVLAIGTAPAGIDFDSMDGQPTRLIFLVLSPPDKTGPHIQALREIAFLVSDDEKRGKLQNAGSASEVMAVLKDFLIE